MATIFIPQETSQEMNARIETSQPGDTIIFDQGQYALDGPLYFPGKRTIYAQNQVFYKKPFFEGPALCFTGEGTDLIGTTIFPPHIMFSDH